MKKNQALEKFSTIVTRYAGTSNSFITALVIILVWLATGPFFHYSDTWQLVINTGTTIITFLMVFLIQRSQNKESVAIQIKLNELVASSKFASNRLIDVEDLSEDELVILHDYYSHLASMCKRDKSMRISHSIDEAEDLHERKEQARKDS